VARIDELRLVTRVARLYHEAGLKQPEIAARLRLSQPKVSRLLKQALDEGIVRITVGAPVGTHVDLEERLEARFGLQDVIVVDVTGDGDEEQLVRSIGAAAAFYVETTVRSGDVVGISSWSATLLAMVDSLHPVAGVRDVKVVQILGGVGDPAASGHAIHLLRRLAQLVHADEVFLPAPGIVGSSAAGRILLEDPFVKGTHELFDRLTVALVGIGSVEPSDLLARSGNVFSPAELAGVRDLGGVGDICLRFFNARGEPILDHVNERVIGIELDQLKRVPRSIGVAGGRRKVAAIQGALRGGWINCLITDQITAELLLGDRPDKVIAEAEPVGADR
jgi:DNA-binding transcriptional regulator LsrR (DeoR family)